ncbi:23877_t:CDS:2 [Dentiscutata erythropus]|uniref:23877_t:CDS:1 n=1 Tax=Dentiscutata erythropus TaxID=1348616 RepID=A0A9N9G412_9GLOM|nr:23877_t:CDS:2 [Dentiscutata erythropus]
MSKKLDLVALHITLTEENIEINKEIQILHCQEYFWSNLKYLHNFIHMIESNNLLLSTAYIEFNKLLNWDELIEEIIQLANNKSSELILSELADYVEKTGPFSSQSIDFNYNEELDKFINIEETINIEEDINVEKLVNENYNNLNLLYNSDLNKIDYNNILNTNSL